MQGFKDITIQVSLNAGEARHLGKLTLQAGPRTETVHQIELPAAFKPFERTAELRAALPYDSITWQVPMGSIR